MKRIGHPCPRGVHVVLKRRDRYLSALPRSWCPVKLVAWLRCLNSGLHPLPKLVGTQDTGGAQGLRTWGLGSGAPSPS